MKLLPCFQNQIINLPAETVLPELSTATREELAVLIAVSALREFETAALSAKLNITENMLLSALNLWIRRGVLTVVEDEKNDRQTQNIQKVPLFTDAKDKKTSLSSAIAANGVKTDGKPLQASAIDESAPRITVLQRTTLPHYSTDEVASYLETHENFSELMDFCQMELGKILNTAEITILIGLVDHLSLSREYVMLLFKHAKEMGKKSVRYIEKMAIEFFDRGILTYQELLEELSAREEAAAMETHIRKLFGIGRRALIEPEKAMVARWTNDYRLTKEMIDHAYEITVRGAKEPSFAYMNAVIENWRKAGRTTMEEVLAAEEAYRRDKEEKSALRGSFDTDEFFEAALRRSYESKQKPEKK